MRVQPDGVIALSLHIGENNGLVAVESENHLPGAKIQSRYIKTD